jgi:lipopolysaccharide/colanic/teichoic acid biosynthesis glycosyltransferase
MEYRPPGKWIGDGGAHFAGAHAKSARAWLYAPLPLMRRGVREEQAVTQLRVARASSSADPLIEPVSAGAREVVNEESFMRMISIERKRSERSKEPFLLMLLETGNQRGTEKAGRTLDRMVAALLPSTRETDVIGWYKERTTIGVLFTGLVVNDKNALLSMILGKVSATLKDKLTFEQFNQVSISLHFFPDDWDHDDSGRPSNPTLYPDLINKDKGKWFLLGSKRAMDILGSSLMLILCAPLFVIIAMTIKATSRGPVLFRQQRVGQFGQCFTFLKFRSMRVDNDHNVHKEFVMKLIANETVRDASSRNGEGIFKIANDSRVTRVGKILRRTSLDELPQFLNVLIGDMSLVGPRPPIPYELAAYQTWHRRRVLESKPGITGLWQVTGRSRVKFDEMVRLDLRYASTWSPWLDFKILLRTPIAVIKGAGAV